MCGTMATVKLSAQDKKDLDKFTKFLALKSAQIIVQSRLGEKVTTQCKPQQGTDWFNIAIQDIPDVLAEAKKALLNEAGTAKLPICIEISLRTLEGDQMILETWVLGIVPEQCDPLVRVQYTVYNRMGILLKSLVSVTRVTPAYKLSRRQGPDSYVIYYRIYKGEPQVHNLGDGSKQVRVGQLCTPVGTLHISVAYRTKMTISPTASGGVAVAGGAGPVTGNGTSGNNTRDNLLMLKSDHFRRDASPKRQNTRLGRVVNEKKVIDLNKPMRPGAFVDMSRVKKYTEQDYLLPEEPAFSWLLTKKDEVNNKKNKSPDTNGDYVINEMSDDNLECQIDANCCNNNNDPCNHNHNQNDDINHDDKDKSDDDSMERTLSAESMTNWNRTSKDSDDNEGSPRTQEKRKSRWTLPVEDEKLMKELHFPFATTSSPIGDLARFYRECYHAPPLQTFDAPEMKPIDAIGDVTEQLQQFEVSLGEFDSMVSSLCQSGNNNSS